MSKLSVKDPPMYYREKTLATRKFRFCLKPVNITQTKEQKPPPAAVSVLVNTGKQSGRGNGVQIENDEARKVQVHVENVLRNLQKIHKGLIWNYHIGRSFVNKLSPNSSMVEERNVDCPEEGAEFDALCAATWSPDCLEHVAATLTAAEVAYDGLVALFCVEAARPEAGYDSDEVAWEIEKVLVYHAVKADPHRLTNPEGVMARQGLEPVSRKIRTPGRGHNGYMVYLAYQLVESVTFAQVMSETLHLAADIRAKKKQLIHMVGDQRFPPPVEERAKRQIEQVKEWVSKDQLAVMQQVQLIKNSEQLKVVSQLLQLIQSGGASGGRGGSAGSGGSASLGLPQFLAFLATQQGGGDSGAGQAARISNGSGSLHRSSSRQSVISINQSTPSVQRSASARNRKGSCSSISNFSSCSTTPETPRRISSSSQDSSGGSVTSRSLGLPRRQSHLEDIQSDSDSTTVDTNTQDRKDSAGKIRRETMPRLIKPNRPVRRTGSFSARQQQAVGLSRAGTAHQLTNPAANQESLADSVNQSEPEADQELHQRHGSSSGQEGHGGVVSHTLDAGETNMAASDDRLVAASVKISRQVKRTNSLNSPRVNYPTLGSPRISTPTNNRRI